MTQNRIKFKEQIEELIENRSKLPERAWKKTDGGMYEVIWFMDRQKPSVEIDYSFDEERFGLTSDGKIIWGFDSGCSCPLPWNDCGDGVYHVKEWKEFQVSSQEAFDADWQEECYASLQGYLKMIA